jgi:hypothetical protein
LYITTAVPTLATPDDRPEILPCEKAPSSAPAVWRLSVPQLHRYIVHKVSNWKVFQEIAQDPIKIVLDLDEPLLECQHQEILSNYHSHPSLFQIS